MVYTIGSKNAVCTITISTSFETLQFCHLRIPMTYPKLIIFVRANNLSKSFSSLIERQNVSHTRGDKYLERIWYISQKQTSFSTDSVLTTSKHESSQVATNNKLFTDLTVFCKVSNVTQLNKMEHTYISTVHVCM